MKNHKTRKLSNTYRKMNINWNKCICKNQSPEYNNMADNNITEIVYDINISIFGITHF